MQQNVRKQIFKNQLIKCEKTDANREQTLIKQKPRKKRIIFFKHLPVSL